MKKINPKYLIIAAIVIIVLIVVIIIGVGKGKDTHVKDNDVTGTNIEETISSEDVNSSESTTNEVEGDENTESSEQSEGTVEVIIQDIDPETGKPIEIVQNTEELTPEEIKAKQEEINKHNQEKLDKAKDESDNISSDILEQLPDEIKNNLNETEEEKLIKSIGNDNNTLNIEGNTLDVENLQIPVYMSENVPMHKEQKDAGFIYWWAYNFMVNSEDNVIKVYSELHEFTSADSISSDIFEAYTNFKGVTLTRNRTITDEKTESNAYDKYNTSLYKYTTDDGCTIYDLYIIPNYSLLNNGDTYRVYSISVNDKEVDGIDEAKGKIEGIINKILGISDFSFSL